VVEIGVYFEEGSRWVVCSSAKFFAFHQSWLCLAPIFALICPRSSSRALGVEERFASPSVFEGPNTFGHQQKIRVGLRFKLLNAQQTALAIMSHCTGPLCRCLWYPLVIFLLLLEGGSWEAIRTVNHCWPIPHPPSVAQRVLNLLGRSHAISIIRPPPYT